MATHTVKKEILKQQINSIFTRATTIQFQLEWQYTFLTTSWHFLFIIFWCRITWSGLESQWVSFMKRCFLLWQVLNKGINIYKRRTYYIMNRLKQCEFLIELLFSNLDAQKVERISLLQIILNKSTMPYHAAIVSHVLCLCFEAWKLFFELHFINRWTCFHFERPCKTTCNVYSPRDHLVLRLYLQYINLYNCSNYRNERGWARKLLLKIQVLFYLFLPWQLFKKRYVDAKTNLANTSHCTRIKQYDSNLII